MRYFLVSNDPNFAHYRGIARGKSKDVEPEFVVDLKENNCYVYLSEHRMTIEDLEDLKRCVMKAILVLENNLIEAA